MHRKQSNRYRNFRDPVGLAMRMVKSGSYGAVWPLVQSAMACAAYPLNRFAAEWDELVPATDESIPQILIVGLPRSGTTLVSQILSQQLEVSYFPNVSALVPNAPIWATQRFLGDFDQVPPSVSSFFGSTTGFRGINDGFHIWNRWLGVDRYRVVPPTAEWKSDLRSFFATWKAVFGKPLLNKNNRNVDAIDLLAPVLPDAIWVVVRRDLIATVQSLLKARSFVQGSSSVGWGLFSDQCDPNADAIESTCQQVALGQRRLDNQLAELDSRRFLQIDYEEFCSEPQAMIQRITATVDFAHRRDDANEIAALRPTSNITISNSDQRKIRDRLATHGALS